MTSVFSAMNSVTPICYFRSNRILSVQPKHTTRCHQFHNRKNSLPLILCFSDPAPLNESCPLQASHFLSLLYVVTQGSDPVTTNSRGRERLHLYQALLGNWCQRGRERSHQSLSLREITSEKERERSPGGENTSRKYFSRILDAWCSRGEMLTCLLKGRGMFIWSVVLICISIH